MFHRSFGLMMIRDNIEAPCTLLDFPTEEAFIGEITRNAYDVVGISAIMTNLGKVRRMCDLVRRHLPAAAIVVGGHISALSGIENRIDADHVVTGEGIRWFQRYLGQDDRSPHPSSSGDLRFRRQDHGDWPGRPPRRDRRDPHPLGGLSGRLQLLLHLGPLRGGKGKFVNFFETGDELFAAIVPDRGKAQGPLLLHTR